MISIKDFINRSIDNYNNISYYDSLKSSFLLYVFIAFVILFVGMMSGFFVGLKDIKLMVYLAIVLLLIVWIWVNLSRYYEIKSPVKRKVFDYRLAMGLETLKHCLDDFESKLKRKKFLRPLKRDFLSLNIILNARRHPATIYYTCDLTRNIGGIRPGSLTQSSTGIVSPRTYFLAIQGRTALFPKQNIKFLFSARADDEENEAEYLDGYGVFLYDAKTYKAIKRIGSDHDEFIRKLKKATDETILKGAVEFDNGLFKLTVFDNILIGNWRRPLVVYRQYNNSSKLAGSGIEPEKQAFYGSERILALIVS